MFNSRYNFKDSIMYENENNVTQDTEKRRLSSLTGPSFGLNLITNLDQINYMDGEITKQVQNLFNQFVNRLQIKCQQMAITLIFIQ